MPNPTDATDRSESTYSGTTTKPIPGETVPEPPREHQDATFADDAVFRVYDAENADAWIDCDSGATIDITE